MFQMTSAKQWIKWQSLNKHPHSKHFTETKNKIKQNWRTTKNTHTINTQTIYTSNAHTHTQTHTWYGQAKYEYNEVRTAQNIRSATVILCSVWFRNRMENDYAAVLFIQLEFIASQKVFSSVNFYGHISQNVSRKTTHSEQLHIHNLFSSVFELTLLAQSMLWKLRQFAIYI